MSGDLSLLNPEWQGYGVDAAVYDGAVSVVRTLFGDAGFVRIDVPAAEALAVRDGVLGLSSIAPRFRHTLDDLRRRAPDRILHVGGTCGAELAPVAWLNERYAGDLAVVWLDAHGDLNTPASSPSGHFHGMALRTLLGQGPVSLTAALRRPLVPRQVFLAGTRDLDSPEAQFVTSAGISVTTCDELAAPEVLVERIRSAGHDHVYVHLDLDVLDPSIFPDALMPTPGGITPAAVASAIRALNDAHDVVGLSVVEYCQRSAGGLPQIGQTLRDAGVRIGALQ
jgi:arginase